MRFRRLKILIREGAKRFALRFVHRSEKAVKFGLTIVVMTALPLVYLMAFEAAPDEYRPYFIAEKPGIAAVRAMEGPGRADRARTVETPDFVKGIYITTSTVGWKTRFDELVALVGRTELNALVIDVKDYRGAIAFAPQSEDLKPYAADPAPLGNLAELTAPLKEKGIYLIARLFVFQDPIYAEANPAQAVQRSYGGLWRDYRGIPWLDPAARKVWQYNAAIAKEAFVGGFDEVQFDYIRFPSDGSLQTMSFPVWDRQKPKYEVMADFFTYLDNELRIKNGMPISVDLFGLTMWQHDYDLNIGQRLRDSLPHFDFISPMVYPSHYPAGFNGYPNPAVRPYDVVYLNLLRGNELVDSLAAEDAARLADDSSVRPVRLATFRPWIQDFDLGAVYTADLVRAQMEAAEDGGASGWLLWNAANRYTESALLPAEPAITDIMEDGRQTRASF